MSKVELLKYLLSTNLSISWTEVGIAIVSSAILATLIYFVYKKTYTGVLYSKSFNASLVITTIITTVIILIIGSNLALSLGMVGSLSIIRFRTAIKDPKDMTYMFWAIGTGIACGSNMYFLGFIGFVVVAVCMFIFSKGVNNSTTYLLMITCGPDVSVSEITGILKKNLKNFRLKIKTVTTEKTDVTYEVDLRKVNEDDLINELKKIIGTGDIKLISYDGEISG